MSPKGCVRGPMSLSRNVLIWLVSSCLAKAALELECYYAEPRTNGTQPICYILIYKRGHCYNVPTLFDNKHIPFATPNQSSCQEICDSDPRCRFISFGLVNPLTRSALSLSDQYPLVRCITYAACPKLNYIFGSSLDVFAKLGVIDDVKPKTPKTGYYLFAISPTATVLLWYVAFALSGIVIMVYCSAITYRCFELACKLPFLLWNRSLSRRMLSWLPMQWLHSASVAEEVTALMRKHRLARAALLVKRVVRVAIPCVALLSLRQVQQVYFTRTVNLDDWRAVRDALARTVWPTMVFASSVFVSIWLAKEKLTATRLDIANGCFSAIWVVVLWLASQAVEDAYGYLDEDYYKLQLTVITLRILQCILCGNHRLTTVLQLSVTALDCAIVYPADFVYWQSRDWGDADLPDFVSHLMSFGYREIVHRLAYVLVIVCVSGTIRDLELQTSHATVAAFASDRMNKSMLHLLDGMCDATIQLDTAFQISAGARKLAVLLLRHSSDRSVPFLDYLAEPDRLRFEGHIANQVSTRDVDLPVLPLHVDFIDSLGNLVTAVLWCSRSISNGLSVDASDAVYFVGISLELDMEAAPPPLAQTTSTEHVSPIAALSVSASKIGRGEQMAERNGPSSSVSVRTGRYSVCSSSSSGSRSDLQSVPERHGCNYEANIVEQRHGMYVSIDEGTADLSIIDASAGFFALGDAGRPPSRLSDLMDRKTVYNISEWLHCQTAAPIRVSVRPNKRMVATLLLTRTLACDSLHKVGLLSLQGLRPVRLNVVVLKKKYRVSSRASARVTLDLIFSEVDHSESTWIVQEFESSNACFSDVLRLGESFLENVADGTPFLESVHSRITRLGESFLEITCPGQLPSQSDDMGILVFSCRSPSNAPVELTVKVRFTGWDLEGIAAGTRMRLMLSLYVQDMQTTSQMLRVSL